MIELTIRKTAVRFDFSFFAVLFIFFFFDNGGGFAAISACAVHELGHLALMALVHIPVEGIMFYGAGIRISSDLSNAGFIVRLAVLSAGAVINLALSMAFYMAGQYTLSAVNLVTGTFNLLPLGEFDGAQIARLITVRRASPERVDVILRRLEYFSIAVCLSILLIFGRSVSITYFVTIVYLLILMCRKC